MYNIDVLNKNMYSHTVEITLSANGVTGIFVTYIESELQGALLFAEIAQNAENYKFVPTDNSTIHLNEETKCFEVGLYDATTEIIQPLIFTPEEFMSAVIKMEKI